MKYINFVPAWVNPFVKKKKVTSEWAVMSVTGDELGWVKWFAQWRCYGFYPNASTVFEKTCLNDIATFCDEQTKAHRANRKLIRDATPKA